MKNSYICKKSSHFAKNYYKIKKKNKKNTNNTCHGFGRNDYTFIANKRSSMVFMSKWIIDSSITKHMILYKYSFETYKIILATKVWLGKNGMV